MKYKIGDVLREDRSHYIGTPQEHKDKEFPLVDLEILAVSPLYYFFMNLTRGIKSYGHVALIDTQPSFTLVSEGLGGPAIPDREMEGLVAEALRDFQKQGAR